MVCLQLTPIPHTLPPPFSLPLPHTWHLYNLPQPVCALVASPTSPPCHPSFSLFLPSSTSAPPPATAPPPPTALPLQACLYYPSLPPHPGFPTCHTTLPCVFILPHAFLPVSSRISHTPTPQEARELGSACAGGAPPARPRGARGSTPHLTGISGVIFDTPYQCSCHVCLPGIVERVASEHASPPISNTCRRHYTRRRSLLLRAHLIDGRRSGAPGYAQPPAIRRI